MINLAKLDEQLRAAGVPVATVREKGNGPEVVLVEGAKRSDFSAQIAYAIAQAPEAGPAERLLASGLDPERSALALVLARGGKAPAWALDLVEALAAKAVTLLGDA